MNTGSVPGPFAHCDASTCSHVHRVTCICSIYPTEISPNTIYLIFKLHVILELYTHSQFDGKLGHVMIFLLYFAFPV